MKRLLMISFLAIFTLALFSKTENSSKEDVNNDKLSLTKIKSFLLEDDNFFIKNTFNFSVNEKNEIYVFDIGTKRIIKYNENGKRIKVFGKKGQGPGEFQSACGLAINDENQILIPDGKFINIFNSEGVFNTKIRIKHELGQLRDIQAYKNGYVIRNSLSKNNLYLNRVDRLDKNFNIVTTIYQKAVKPSEFKQKKRELLYLHTVDSVGNVYITPDATNDYKVIKFNNLGKKLYVINKKSKKILKSTKSLKKLKEYFVKKGLNSIELENEMEKYKYKPKIINIYADPSNRLWIVTSSDNQNDNSLYLDVYTNSGEFLSKIKLPDVNFPTITVCDKKLYVLDSLSKNDLSIQIYKINKN